MEIINENQNIHITSKKRLSLALFINYFVHGMVLVILMQNMLSLAHSWSTSIAVVSYVISGIGIGRLIAYPITGVLADRLNRKTFVLIGMILYIIFLSVMPFASNMVLAYILAILAGVGNSALDAGTYTTLVEMNNGSGKSTVLIKAFMSAGDFILPLLVFFLDNRHLWFGISFILPAIILIFNLFNILSIRFPNTKKLNDSLEQNSDSISKVKKIVVTIGLLAYGYTSMALMLIFTQWITLYSSKVLHLSIITSHFLLSLYSIGSITGVLVISFILKQTSCEELLVVILNLTTLLALVGISLAPTALMAEVFSLVVGFSAAGGVMQTGLTIFMKLFPERRGTITGIFYFFGSIASLTIPLITGFLSTKGIGLAFNFSIIISLISSVFVILVMMIMKSNKE
ncbi:MFS transporter [Apilactobacillus kunkeei]|uniref:MFS transporter n=1 Tax=Apilactobacillus kunkeei TaxID=148814 RepID=UPI00403354D0